jgi:type IV pilus assembly protein PilW
MMTNTIHRRSSAHGFSLIELLVAMVIALIITLGVVQIFTSNRTAYQVDEALARAQENGRFAIEFLSQDIRHAGYMGCKRYRIGRKDTPIDYLVGGQQNLPPMGISGSEYTLGTGTGIGATYSYVGTPFPIANTTAGWSPALNTNLVTGSNSTSGAQPGTDVISVDHLETAAIPLVSPYVDIDNVYISPSSANAFNVGDVLMVADCGHAAVFQVTGITTTGTTTAISHVTGVGSPGNRCAQWNGPLAANVNAATPDCPSTFEQVQPNIMIGRIQTVTFYVAQAGTQGGPCTTTGACQPTLYKRVTDPGGNGALPVALVEGVENLQVLYGEDLNQDGIADRYVTANQVSNFSLVTSVRIGLLVHGANAAGPINNETTSDTNTYIVDETTIVPNPDRLRRRVFTTTIQLRNRGF